jgi:hypothetical protein
MNVSVRASALCVVAAMWAAAPVTLAQPPPPDGYVIRKLGLTGDEYEYPLGSGFVRNDAALFLTDSARVPGHTQRYDTAGATLGQDAWMYDDAATRVIGLTGDGYEYTAVGGGIYRFSHLRFFNASGHAAGYSRRFSPSGVLLGNDAWLYDGVRTQLVGLTGNAGGATYGLSEVRLMNSAGQVAGTTSRYSSSRSLGGDAWVFDGTASLPIGLTGIGYEISPSPGSIHRNSIPLGMSAAGHVFGRSLRWNSERYSLGEDAWVFKGAATQLIGLTGEGYEYALPVSGGGTWRTNYLQLTNQTGQAIGFSTRVRPTGPGLGQDVWFYNGTNTHLVGLTGSGYEYVTDAGGLYRGGYTVSLNDAGHVIGGAARYNASGGYLGEDPWIFDGSTTHRIGLSGDEYEYDSTVTGGGKHRLGHAKLINDAGQVIGFARRFGASAAYLGQDNWLYDGTTTQLVGLTGSGYQYATPAGTYRFGEIRRFNQAGQLTGVTQRYSASGAYLGTDAWHYDGGAISSIGLTGSGYEYANAEGLFRAGDALLMNEAGEVVGRTSRYDSAGAFLGVSGWFFDDETGVTMPLEFSFRSPDNYCFTSPALLTEEGAVLGSYELFDATNSLGSRAFLWSATDGFHDLGALVDGGLPAAGWEALSNVYSGFGTSGTTPDGSPRHIVGTGLAVGQIAGQSVYLLSLIPEPTSVGLFALAALPVVICPRCGRGSARSTTRCGASGD